MNLFKNPAKNSAKFSRLERRTIAWVCGLSLTGLSLTGLAFTGLGLTAAVTAVSSFPKAAIADEPGLFNSAVDQLPASTRVSLRSGNAVVSGDKGRYVARVLVTGTSDMAWSVLTDYNNFPKFLPNIISTKIIETKGNQKVVEQVDSRQVFLFTIKSRVRLAISESDKRNKVEFRQIDGDLQNISGYWQIEPIAPYQGAASNQVLITQVVEAQPKSGTPRDTFFDIFKGSLNQTMLAVSREVTTREARTPKTIAPVPQKDPASKP